MYDQCCKYASTNGYWDARIYSFDWCFTPLTQGEDYVGRLTENHDLLQFLEDIQNARSPLTGGSGE